MNWFMRWILGTPWQYRRTDGCDQAELALARQWAELLEAREIAIEQTNCSEESAC